MKLTQLAFFMTFTLLGVTGWIAWDSHSQATGARNELEMYQRREAAGTRLPGFSPTSIAAQNAMLLKEQQILALQGAGKVTAADNSPIPGSLPQDGAAISLPPVKPTLPPAVNTPPPLSPLQHRVMSMPALAKVLEYQKDYGFVILNAGSTKNVSTGSVFMLRRGSAIIARIKIGDVDNDTSVGGLDLKSIPAGVTVEVGDEVIQDLPPEA